MLSAPASSAARTISSICSGASLMPGSSGAITTPTSSPAPASCPSASRRARGLGVRGSDSRQARSSIVGTERYAVNRVRSAICSIRSMSRVSSGDFVSTLHGFARSLSASQMPRISS